MNHFFYLVSYKWIFSVAPYFLTSINIAAIKTIFAHLCKFLELELIGDHTGQNGHHQKICKQ